MIIPLKSSRPRGRNWNHSPTTCWPVFSEKWSLCAMRHGPAGCKKLKGFKDHWRVRVGDWRVVYIIEDAARLVSITRIAHRREVYE